MPTGRMEISVSSPCWYERTHARRGMHSNVTACADVWTLPASTSMMELSGSQPWPWLGKRQGSEYRSDLTTLPDPHAELEPDPHAELEGVSGRWRLRARVRDVWATHSWRRLRHVTRTDKKWSQCDRSRATPPGSLVAAKTRARAPRPIASDSSQDNDVRTMSALTAIRMATGQVVPVPRNVVTLPGQPAGEHPPPAEAGPRRPRPTAIVACQFFPGYAPSQLSSSTAGQGACAERWGCPRRKAARPGPTPPRRDPAGWPGQRQTDWRRGGKWSSRAQSRRFGGARGGAGPMRNGGVTMMLPSRTGPQGPRAGSPVRACGATRAAAAGSAAVMCQQPADQLLVGDAARDPRRQPRPVKPAALIPERLHRVVMGGAPGRCAGTGPEGNGLSTGPLPASRGSHKSRAAPSRWHPDRSRVRRAAGRSGRRLVSPAPVRPGWHASHQQPAAEIAGLGPGRAVPSHPDRPQEPEPAQASPIPYERKVAADRPAACRSARNVATEPTALPSASTSRQGSQTSPVSCRKPAWATNQARQISR